MTLRQGTYPTRFNVRLQGQNYRWPRRRQVPEWFFEPTPSLDHYFGYLPVHDLYTLAVATFSHP